jgi:hypothetical protein
MQVIMSSISSVFTTSRDDQPQRIQQTQEEAWMQGRFLTVLTVAMAGIALLTFNSAFAEEKIQPQTGQDLKAVMQNEAPAKAAPAAFFRRW